MGASQCSLCGVNSFGLRSVFSVDAFHLLPQFVLAIIPFVSGVTCVVVTKSLHWMLSEASSLLCDCNSPFRGRVSSLVIGVEVPRSVFELQCEMGGLLECSHWEWSYWISLHWSCLPGCELYGLAHHPLYGLTKYTVLDTDSPTSTTGMLAIGPGVPKAFYKAVMYICRLRATEVRLLGLFSVVLHLDPPWELWRQPRPWSSPASMYMRPWNL